MNFYVREGKLDVVIAAAPSLEVWPSVGVKTLSLLCTNMGLEVGQFGGDSLKVRGVVPLPSTGGLIFIEDAQSRIHRIHARAIVRISPEETFPDPFPGWRSPGLIPISSAERLLKTAQLVWEPSIVILGTGNRALRLGSQLLDSGTQEVFCIEANPHWSAKRYSGWEVEKRRFEIAGGKIIEANPLQISPIGPQLWQIRLKDHQGVRVIETGKIISAGPFAQQSGFKEYPPGSSLFELQQTAKPTPTRNMEGWTLEKERSRWLALKIIKNLVHDTGEKREELEKLQSRTKSRLKRFIRHQQNPFTPSYQGKWLSLSDTKNLKSFSGVPKIAHQKKLIASIECFEDISCQICQKACPTSAIQVGFHARSKNQILDEQACTSCGICVVVCPTQTIPLIEENPNQSNSQLVLPSRSHKPWRVGEFVTLINRKGDSLGSGRVSKLLESQEKNVQLVQLEIPSHLIWEARGFRRPRAPASEDDLFLADLARSDQAMERVEVSINGEKRLVRDQISISHALFEIGQNRPQDSLLCQDGSCQLCYIVVDGIKKLACQTQIHSGMTIRTQNPQELKTLAENDQICPCLELSSSSIAERLHQGKLQSPEAVLSVTHVGEGKCHGQLCMGATKRLLQSLGLETSQWIDWRFPWSDWILRHN